jgi:hypothetical protein
MATAAEPPVKVNEELNYSAPPVQWKIIGGREEKILPVESQVDAKFIKFLIPNNYVHQLIQPGRCYLKTTCRLVNKTGQAMARTVDNAGPIDNIASSMWYNQTVTFGQHVIERTDDTYPYKAKIHQDINWTELDRESRGVQLGYDNPDKPYDMDSTDSTRGWEDTYVADTVGDKTYKGRFTKGQPDTPLAARNRAYFEPFQHGTVANQQADPTEMIYYPNLWCTPFDQPVDGPLLPPNIDLRIEMMRSSPEFYMMDGSAGEESAYRLEITDIKLVVWYVKVTPDTWDSMTSLIAKDGLKIYLPQRYDIKRHVLHQQAQQTVQLIVNESMPSRLFFVIVDGDAMSGNKAKNPFNFQHCDLVDYYFSKGGEMFPQGERNDIDFNHLGKFLTPWIAFLKASGVPQDGHGSIITPDNYAGGSTIIGVNFTAMVDEGENVQHIVSPGLLQLSLRFKTAPKGKQLLAISYYDNDYIQVTKDNQVTTSWV